MVSPSTVEKRGLVSEAWEANIPKSTLETSVNALSKLCTWSSDAVDVRNRKTSNTIRTETGRMN